MKREEIEWKKNESVVVSKWKDTRDVLTISNKHKLELVPVSNKRDEVKMNPNNVRDFNNTISGICHSDQMLFYYHGLRNSVRWYTEIWFHFMKMLMHNSFYLFKQAKTQKKINLIDFCADVVNSLLDFDKM